MSTAWLLLLLAAGCCAAPAKKNVFPPYEPLFTPEELEEIMKLIEGFDNTTETTERSTQPVLNLPFTPEELEEIIQLIKGFDNTTETTERSTQPVLPFTPEQLEEIIQLITTVTKRQEVGEVIDPIVIDWDYFNWIRTLVTKKRQDLVTPWEQRGMTEEQYWKWINTLGKRQTLAETLEQLGMTEEEYREWMITLGKRQVLPLYEPPLTYDQIMDLVASHVTRRNDRKEALDLWLEKEMERQRDFLLHSRRDLVTPWEQLGMTEEHYREWIITLGKRQDLPLFDHLSYDQIIDLISAHVTKKRQDLVTPWEQRGMTEEQYREWYREWIITLGKRQTLAETLEQLGMTEEQYREWMITLGKRQDLATPWEQLGMTEEYYREWIITLGKRQDLYDPPLTYDQIMDLVASHGKRQDLYDPPLTYDQIMDLVASHERRRDVNDTQNAINATGLPDDWFDSIVKGIVALTKVLARNSGTLSFVPDIPTFDVSPLKRQDLPLYEPPLTYDQIMDLVASHVTKKKRDLAELLERLDMTEEEYRDWITSLGKREFDLEALPTTAEIAEIAQANGIDITEGDLQALMGLLGKRQDAYIWDPNQLTYDTLNEIVSQVITEEQQNLLDILAISVGKRQLVIPSNLDVLLQEWLESENITMEQYLAMLDGVNVLRKRQNLPLFEPPLTTDQILNLISDFTTRKRQCLTGTLGKRQDVYDPPLTTDQIISIIANGGVTRKRQCLDKTEESLLGWMQTLGKRQDVYDPPLITDKIISIIELASGGVLWKRGSLAEMAAELNTTEERLLGWMQTLGKRQDFPLYQPALTTDQIINIIANGGVGKRQDLPLYEPALTTDQIINIIANGGVGKRQDLPLYEPALTTDQIINIIANGGVGKRQDLPLFEPALTTGQIINIIANGGVGKRQDLPLFEPALTHDQIMDLVAQYTTGKRQEVVHEIAHVAQSKRESHHLEHRPRVHNPSDPVPPEEESEAVLLTVQEMNYDQILALLGEYMKGH